jgi:BASS family bile acid:Na+ symporter
MMTANLGQALVLVFSLATLFSTGLGVTLDDFALALRDKRALARALLANAVLTPVLAWLLLRGVALLGSEALPEQVRGFAGLSAGQRIVLLLLALAGGNLLAPALAKLARGGVDYSRAMTAIVALLSVLVVPVGLAILPVNAVAPGAEGAATGTDAAAAVSALGVLAAMQLAPLAVGLLVRARYASLAAAIQPFGALLANISLLALAVTLLMPGSGVALRLLGGREQEGMAPLAVWGVVLAAGALLIGWLMGGVNPPIARGLGIVTGLRNLSTVLALVVFANGGSGWQSASQSAAGALVAYAAMLVVVTLAAGEWSRKPIATPEASADAAGADAAGAPAAGAGTAGAPAAGAGTAARPAPPT